MLTFLFAAVLGYTIHAKDVFQPPRPPAPQAWSAESHERRQPVEFRTMGGSAIRGWLYQADRQDAPWVLFFYGSNEDPAHEVARLG